MPTLHIEYRDENPIIVENTNPITLPFKAYITTKDGKTTTKGINIVGRFGKPVYPENVGGKIQSYWDGSDETPELILKYSNPDSPSKPYNNRILLNFSVVPDDLDSEDVFYNELFDFTMHAEPKQ